MRSPTPEESTLVAPVPLSLLQLHHYICQRGPRLFHLWLPRGWDRKPYTGKPPLSLWLIHVWLIHVMTEKVTNDTWLVTTVSLWGLCSDLLSFMSVYDRFHQKMSCDFLCGILCAWSGCHSDRCWDHLRNTDEVCKYVSAHTHVFTLHVCTLGGPADGEWMVCATCQPSALLHILSLSSIPAMCLLGQL